MKSKLTLIAVSLITFLVGIALTRLTLHPLSSESSIVIPANQLKEQTSCLDAITYSDSVTFFYEFREAVKNKDTHKLYTMTRRCDFSWYSDVALPHPLQYEVKPVPAQLDPPFEVRPVIILRWGDHLVFDSENDFASNIDVIFSPEIREHLLQDTLQRSTACEYAISWRERLLNHLCFESTSRGFKFTGLRIEP